MTGAPDILGQDRRPAFFPVTNAAEIGLEPPEDRIGLPLRTWVRALAGMQKEALVVNGATGKSWRLVSDEGPYLAGHDRAPCPLCTFIAGMVASCMNEVTGLAAARGLDIDDIEPLQLLQHGGLGPTGHDARGCHGAGSGGADLG